MTAQPDTRSPCGLALPVIAGAQLLIVMDGTIVTVGLPVIGSGLGIAQVDLDWVLTAYALAFGGTLLAAGRAGDLFGRRRLFRVGLAVFLLASLLGGIAQNGGMLIAARALQGIGGAMIAPAALSLLAETFPAGRERTRALGVYGAMGGLGSVVGLLLGGALTEYLGWRWIMFVNVPIALVVLAGTFALLPGSRERGGIDLAGAITVTLALGSLVYAINRAGSDGPALLFGAIALVLGIAFAVVERRVRSPMLPAGVLADRGRLGANLVMLLMGAGQLATFYFLTLYMQAVKEYPPLLTGLAYLPFAIGIGIGSGVAGPALQARTSVRTVLAVGMAVAAAAMVWFSTLTPDQGAMVTLLPAQLVAGIGLGIGFVAATIGGVQGVAPQDSGIASGLINTSQQVGGALGLATLASIAVAAHPRLHERPARCGRVLPGRHRRRRPPHAVTSAPRHPSDRRHPVHDREEVRHDRHPRPGAVPLAPAQPRRARPRAEGDRPGHGQGHRERLDPADHRQPGAAARRPDRRQQLPHRPAHRQPPRGRRVRGADHGRGVLAGRVLLRRRRARRPGAGGGRPHPQPERRTRLRRAVRRGGRPLRRHGADHAHRRDRPGRLLHPPRAHRQTPPRGGTRPAVAGPVSTATHDERHGGPVLPARMPNPAYLVQPAGAAIGALMQALQHEVDQGTVPAATLMLAGMRSSQVNGGSACLYADAAGARKAGVTDEQLMTVAAWRQSPFFSGAERAALALAEAATRMNDRTGDAIPDALWDELVTHFDERQRATLILWVAASNLFATINNAIQDPAGTTWG
jgi:EmrB/QacA subfamily drug resistance transporter